MKLVDPEPEKVEVLLVDGVLSNGRTFDFAIREDRGHRVTETPDTLTFVSGATGQEVTVSRSQIAVLSKLTRMVPGGR